MSPLPFEWIRSLCDVNSAELPIEQRPTYSFNLKNRKGDWPHRAAIIGSPVPMKGID
jgi:hypothetical protein